MNKPSFKNLAKIIPYYWLQIRKYKFLFFSVFVCMAVGQIGGIITPLFYRDIIDTLVMGPDAPGIAAELLRLFMMLAIVIAVYNIFLRAGNLIFAKSEYKIMKGLIDYSFEQLTRKSYDFFTNNFTGSLVAKTGRFARAYQSIFHELIFNYQKILLRMIGVFIALLVTDVLIGMIFLVWVILYVFFSVFLAYKRIGLDLERAATASRSAGRLADVMTNIINIKTHGSRPREIREFGRYTWEESRALFRVMWFAMNVNAFQGTFIFLLEILGMGVVLNLWIQGQVTTGTVVLVQSYIGLITGTVWGLGKSISRFTTAATDAMEMVDIFELEQSVKDPVAPQLRRMEDGSISFNSVTYYYQEGVPVFDTFSLMIPAGQKVGLVGHSGAGKSTITKLLLRFADVKDGSITIDGQDIRNITQDDLRKNIAYVPQDSILFHRSLRENIAYHNPEASIEEIIQAAKDAHLYEFITSLPKGFDTLVGERGIKLSGGERQRVAIARAMLKPAPILILDEATSSLDSISERYIQESFEKLMEGRTTIVIAHRLSTIQKLDRILVLDGGTIIEDGDHESLLQKNGSYKELWEHQRGGFIE